MRIIFVSRTVLTIGYINSRIVFLTSNQKNVATVKFGKRFITLSMKYCHLIECLFLTTFSACRVGRKLTFAIIQYLKPTETRFNQKVSFFIYLIILVGPAGIGPKKAKLGLFNVSNLDFLDESGRSYRAS